MTAINKTHPITIRVSTDLLNEIDRRIPDRRRVCREQYVLEAVRAHLGMDRQRHDDLGALTEPEPMLTK